MRKQALLIENSPLYHRFLSEQFAHLGYSSVIADSRQSALARLHAGNYQLICMNMYFEGGNAIELVKEIRRDDPSVVVIMLTSDKSRTLRSHALRAGVTEVIYKSGHKSISRQIARCLKHSRHVHLRGSKVMYVEDSLTQAVMNMQILEGMGLEITHFRTAEAAMASFRISDFDLVITDVLLKGEASGLTLLRHIRSLPGIGRRIPVLTITGYDDAARRQELFRAGTSDYITKPVLKEELVIRVSNLISNKLLADKVEGQQAELYDQVCLRPRDRFWDIPVPKIDSAFDNLLVPQPSWSPSTTQQLRKLVAAPYLAPNDWTPRLDAYFASPLALCARRVSSAASRLLGSTSLRFALHGWQRWR
ncbi:response regulator [Thiolapillus sp.]|uniref:response regulator n=2 Tax=Thiolapillus sp. TaxID=2017437 RepID=UPI0025E8EFBD|nr:response regulator [Thiolapillus sp.]